MLLYRTTFVKKQVEFRYLDYLRFMKRILVIDFTWVFLSSPTEAMVGEHRQLVTEWLDFLNSRISTDYTQKSLQLMHQGSCAYVPSCLRWKTNWVSVPSLFEISEANSSYWLHLGITDFTHWSYDWGELAVSYKMVGLSNNWFSTDHAQKISPIAAPDLKGDTSYKDVLSSLTICFLGWFLVGSALGLLIRV